MAKMEMIYLFTPNNQSSNRDKQDPWKNSYQTLDIREHKKVINDSQERKDTIAVLSLSSSLHSFLGMSWGGSK